MKRSFQRRLERLEAQLGKGKFKEEEQKRERFRDLFYKLEMEGQLTPAEQKEFDLLGPRFLQWYAVPIWLQLRRQAREEEAKRKALLEQTRRELAAKQRLKRKRAEAEEKATPSPAHENRQETREEFHRRLRERRLLTVKTTQRTIKLLARPRQETPSQRQRRLATTKLRTRQDDAAEKEIRARAELEARRKLAMDKRG